MNDGQKKFHDFIMERVIPAQKEAAEQLLQEGFSRQDKGSFNEEYAKGFMPKMLPMLKAEHVEEVKQIMSEFKH